ncbi:unnamed protein product [Caenorhabditis auriculariae]|uniref:Uncharacterized protein n=1 Tax=Caenorhabditis auriculariae TaxID=2777116 RepID=A0A8S1H3N3_9PELO|nr:unnamed protein product [Caenorhabditis auriculariae]
MFRRKTAAPASHEAPPAPPGLAALRSGTFLRRFLFVLLDLHCLDFRFILCLSNRVVELLPSQSFLSGARSHRPIRTARCPTQQLLESRSLSSTHFTVLTLCYVVSEIKDRLIAQKALFTSSDRYLP